MAVVTMKQLLESGVHFGHQARRWNPKMKRFIFMERNGIHIIDLQQTLSRVEEAYIFMRDLAADGGQILFVGTKKQAQDSIEGIIEWWLVEQEIKHQTTAVKEVLTKLVQDNLLVERRGMARLDPALEARERAREEREAVGRVLVGDGLQVVGAPCLARDEVLLEVLAALADDVQGEVPGAGDDVVGEVLAVDGCHQEGRVAGSLRHPRGGHPVSMVPVADGEHVDARRDGAERLDEVASEGHERPG